MRNHRFSNYLIGMGYSRKFSLEILHSVFAVKRAFGRDEFNQMLLSTDFENQIHSRLLELNPKESMENIGLITAELRLFRSYKQNLRKTSNTFHRY